MSKKTFNIIVLSAVVILLILLAVLIVVGKPFSKKTNNVDKIQKKVEKVVQEKDKVEDKKEKKEEKKEGEVLEYLKPYLKENEDLVAWIKVPNTRVNYPVVYRKGDVEEYYYLRRNFRRQHDIYGVPFVDGHVNLNSDNILIHGHETDNGTQFHDFTKYKNYEFWKNNKTFTYDTLTEPGTYEIFAVFYNEVQAVDYPGFKYYKFYGSNNEQEFNSYVNNVKKLSIYDTGITPKYGDKLLTLSLCSYHIEDGRYVVVARKVTSDKDKTQDNKDVQKS